MFAGTQVSLPPGRPIHLLEQLRMALGQADGTTLRSLFVKPPSADYLFSMAANRGGLKKVRISIIPAPPGWQQGYWAIFHTVQTIEEDHDPVYSLSYASERGWRVGEELPEDDTGGAQIDSVRYRAILNPARQSVNVDMQGRLKSRPSKAIPFRLNENYRGLQGEEIADDRSILSPRKGDLVRAGSLLLVWDPHPGREFRFKYAAQLPKSSEDEITPDDAYITSWWLPSLGRLPFQVDATIQGPSDWKIRGEGFEKSAVTDGAVQTCRFLCPIPISYPKIIAGRYREVASRTVDGDRFNIWQISPVDKTKADTDLASMVEAAKFYRKVLGRLPFRGYECYDAARYYGIESYSHTLLQRSITHFISHEMGHSYFGGMAPCPYVHDSWNEGVTQYIDSVVLNKNSDRSLEAGFDTFRIPVPLTKMAVPWDLGDATYWRGCYVLKMLEAEIGEAKVLQALKSIVTNRIGRDTRWGDLRAYFERAGGKSLSWFWSQWIEGGSFPRLSYGYRLKENSSGGWVTDVDVTQTGTSKPFRIKFLTRQRFGKIEDDRLMDMAGSHQTFTLTSKVKPDKVEVILFPFTLGSLQGS